jgi:PmbA protein
VPYRRGRPVVTLALDPDVGVSVAQDAVSRAVAAGADEAKVIHSYRQRFEVNFDTHDVTLVRSTVADDLSITVFVDGSRGSTDLSGRSHDAVDRAVRQAVTAAAAGQPDPANVLPTDAAPPAESHGDEEPDQEAMVDAVLAHIRVAQGEYPAIRADSSYYAFSCSWQSYANSHGRTQHARHGRYAVSTTLTGKDGERATSFNYTGVVADAPFGELTTVPAITRLYRDTAASFDPTPVPGTFVGDVIFTPDAARTLTASIAGALGGLALMRKSTPYAERLGQRIAAATFTMAHRPSALAGASAFDAEGFANADLDVIRDGVLENFLIDWYNSHKLDRPMTTGCSDFLVAPGDDALDDMIGSTRRGILLGRYSGGTPNQKLDFSGVAKNSFYIEDGKVVGPVAETMIAGNFGAALEQIRGVSRETVSFGSFSAPWIATSGITVSTK